MENKIQSYLDLSKKILQLYTDGADEHDIDIVYDEMDNLWESCTEDEKESIRLESIKARENEQ